MAPTTFPEKPRAPPAGLPSFWSNKADGRYWHLVDIDYDAEHVRSGTESGHPRSARPGPLLTHSPHWRAASSLMIVKARSDPACTEGTVKNCHLVPGQSGSAGVACPFVLLASS